MRMHAKIYGKPIGQPSEPHRTRKAGRHPALHDQPYEGHLFQLFHGGQRSLLRETEKEVESRDRLPWLKAYFLGYFDKLGAAAKARADVVGKRSYGVVLDDGTALLWLPLLGGRKRPIHAIMDAILDATSRGSRQFSAVFESFLARFSMPPQGIPFGTRVWYDFVRYD